MLSYLRCELRGLGESAEGQDGNSPKGCGKGWLAGGKVPIIRFRFYSKKLRQVYPQPLSCPREMSGLD